MRARGIGHEEWFDAGPTVRGLRERNLGRTQRFTVRLRRVLLIWRPETDVRLGDDHRRPLRVGLRFSDSGVDGGEIIHVVHMQHLPAVRGEALFGVVAAREIRAAVDRDAVVVEEADQLAQLDVTGVAGRFVRDAFHEAAVARHEVGVVIDDVMTGAIERGREMRLGHGEPDGVGNTLTERTGGRFHTGRVMHFGVARRFTLPLTEALDLGQRQVVARHVQRAVQQHRCMPNRQHESITVGPVWSRRVVT